MSQTEPEVLLRAHEVCRRTTLSRTAIYRAIRLGTFPRPVKVTKFVSAWREADINEWIRARPSLAVVAARGRKESAA